MNAVARLIMLVAAFLSPELAHAYVGPGVGLSAIGSVLALVSAVLLMIMGFVWYPLKQLLKRKKHGLASPETRTNLAEDSQPGLHDDKP